MKKLFSSILAAVFVLSLSSSAVHAAENDYEKVVNDVNKTNKEINEMIYQSVAEVKKEANGYIRNLQIVQYGKDVVDLDNDISCLKEQLCNLDSTKQDYKDKYDKILKQICEKEQRKLELVQKKEEKANILNGQLDELNKELDSLGDDSSKGIKIIAAINKLEPQIDKPDKQSQELTDKFNEKIDKIINELINDTNKKAADMKNRAAEKGFIVTCELIEVEINGKVIKIDPLRVACF